jgi:hypothetical protein
MSADHHTEREKMKVFFEVCLIFEQKVDIYRHNKELEHESFNKHQRT